MAAHSIGKPDRPRGAALKQGLLLRTVNRLSQVCGVVAAFMIFASVLITCQMIWVRFVLNDSTIWQTEAVTYLMISATLIGLPYVQLLRGHVNVDLIPMLLPAALRKALSLLTLVATFLIILAMAFHGYELFHVAFERNWKSDTVWGIQLWIPYIAMPIGFGLFLLQLAADVYGVFAGEEEPFEHGDFEEDY